MFSNTFTDLLSDLEAVLVDGLTLDGIDVFDAEALGSRAIRKMTLTYEAGDIVGTIDGEVLPPGVIGLEITLALIAPEKDASLALPRLFDSATVLWAVLDSMPHVQWTRGERVRTDTGESLYRFPITVLTTYKE